MAGAADLVGILARWSSFRANHALLQDHSGRLRRGKICMHRETPISWEVASVQDWE
jgi:hypothetical protein